MSVAPTEEGAAPLPPSNPPIEAGSLSAEDEALAARLLGDAERALRRGEHARAVGAAEEVVRDYASARGSSEALWILAQAARALGDLPGALAAAERYLLLLPADDPRGDAVVVLEAEVATESGDPRTAVLVVLGSGTERGSRLGRQGRRLVRDAVRLLDTESLMELGGAPADEHPLAAPLLTELGVGLHYRGDLTGAGRAARSALALEIDPVDRAVAEAVLAGRVDDALGAPPSLGVILPQSGSPTLQEYARLIEEGIRVALDARASETRRPIGLQVVDDAGDPTVASANVQALESNGVLGIIGPLLGPGLANAAAARRQRLPMVSPTARALPGGASGVYSLAGPDAAAARLLADFMLRAGLDHIALLYPEGTSSEVEADAFAQRFQAGGGRVEVLTYVSGATYFEEQFRSAEASMPDAVVLPVPTEDVELIAPQVAFFGLDTLGIQVFGTSGWSSPEVTERVDHRILEGVTISAPVDPGRPGEAYDEFVRRYERLFRRTLRSPIPALGYDAAQLLLEAIGSGARSAGDVEAALEGVRDFPGATGRLSVEEGSIVRLQAIYRFDRGRWIPLGTGG